VRPLAIRLRASISVHDPVARAGQSRHPIQSDLETDARHLSTERLTARSLEVSIQQGAGKPFTRASSCQPGARRRLRPPESCGPQPGRSVRRSGRT
jgi:hypothetical protein